MKKRNVRKIIATFMAMACLSVCFTPFATATVFAKESKPATIESGTLIARVRLDSSEVNLTKGAWNPAVSQSAFWLSKQPKTLLFCVTPVNVSENKSKKVTLFLCDSDGYEKKRFSVLCDGNSHLVNLSLTDIIATGRHYIGYDTLPCDLVAITVDFFD